MSSPHAEFIARHPEPPADFWRRPETYGERLEEEFLLPLQAEMKRSGNIPSAMQFDVLYRLHWYFTVDARERAPTMSATAEMADRFHGLVKDVILHLKIENVWALDEVVVEPEIKYALVSYFGAHHLSSAIVDACDHRQDLLRVSYYICGDVPEEEFRLDGRQIKPAYEKYRGIRFFHRLLVRQRIVWLPMGNAKTLSVFLGSDPSEVLISNTVFKFDPALDGMLDLPIVKVKQHFSLGKGGQEKLPAGLAGWKVRCLRMLANFSLVKRLFRKSWVFIDRDQNADDSAEVLYRWVRKNHPEINIWFLLDPGTEDWERLERGGFRLVPPGLKRKLLLLNSVHIISSHAEYVFGGLDRRLYGDMMRWRYSFLQHGVIKDDLSHWLGQKEFDCFITSSPDECQSIVEDDSGYPYTAKEVKLTGLPRHQRLVTLANRLGMPENKKLLIMPTWRGGAFEENMRGKPVAERLSVFADTEYALCWKSLLHNRRLHAAAQKYGWTIAFMPHMNTLPFISFFQIPDCVEVIEQINSEQFVKATAFLTDYTSASFEMALIRRPSFYYQFDQDFFLGGGHNWRLGYYDYLRDGFGPIEVEESALMDELEKFFSDPEGFDVRYYENMRRAMPYQDESSCQRVFDSIVALDRPWQHGRSSDQN